MLNTVHGPSRHACPQIEQPVAAESAGKHDFGAGFVVVGVIQSDRTELHQGFDQRFAKTVGNRVGRIDKELFHRVVDGIGHTGRSMFGIDRFGIGRVKQRADRIKKRVHISDLVIGLRPGNNTATIILTAGSGKRHDIDNGKSILCFYLIRN